MSHLFSVIFIVALIFLSFFSGALLTYHQYFPYSFLYRIHLGGAAWYEDNIGETNQGVAIRKNHGKAAKVKLNWRISTYQADKSSDDFMLVCPFTAPEVHLVDSRGNFIRKWRVPKNITKKSKGKTDHVRAIHLYPNGDLLVIYKYKKLHAMLMRLNSESEIVWKIGSERFHHDIAVDASGVIYTLTRSSDNKPFHQYEPIKTPFLHEYLVVISPDGKIIKKISLLEAFIDTPYEWFLKFLAVKGWKGDLTHHNTVELLTPELAPKFPHLNVGDILLSPKHMSTIAVIRPTTGKIVWAKRGDWRQQHDPDFLPNGRILLFDNEGEYKGKPDEKKREKRSRILEIDGVDGSVIESHDAANGLDFYTFYLGNQQMLQNGNILVNSSLQNRIIEWSKKDGIVRDLRNESFRELVCLHSFPKDQLPFLAP